MKIVVNSAIQRFGGAVQVVLSFVNECRNYPEYTYVVWVGEGLRKSLKEQEFPSNFKFVHFDFGTIDLKKTSEVQRRLRQQELLDRPDVMIATSGPTYYQSLCPQIIGFNIPSYIYPESPFVKGLNPYRAFRRWLKIHLHMRSFRKSADAFVVQTEDVKERLERMYGIRNVHVVSNTASSFYRQELTSSKSLLPERKVGEFRFVTISSYYGHKNLEIIPLVLQELAKRGIGNVQFVLTLPPSDFEKYIGHHEGIVNVGPVKPADCPALYQECDALFLPTLLECFSASYAEAMIMEKPIVTTSMSFAQSICRDAALYFRPMNAVDATEKIIELLENKSLQKVLVQNGKVRVEEFDSPAVRAQNYLDLCQQLVTHKQEG